MISPAMAAARMTLSALAVALFLPSTAAGDATIRTVERAPGYYSTSAMVRSKTTTNNAAPIPASGGTAEFPDHL